MLSIWKSVNNFAGYKGLGFQGYEVRVSRVNALFIFLLIFYIYGCRWVVRVGIFLESGFFCDEIENVHHTVVL